jgi:hypothetical protein
VSITKQVNATELTAARMPTSSAAVIVAMFGMPVSETAKMSDLNGSHCSLLSDPWKLTAREEDIDKD